jgi:hypothetical protein
VTLFYRIEGPAQRPEVKTEKHIDRWTDEYIEGWKDRQRDRQIDKYKVVQI